MIQKKNNARQLDLLKRRIKSTRILDRYRIWRRRIMREIFNIYRISEEDLMKDLHGHEIEEEE